MKEKVSVHDQFQASKQKPELKQLFSTPYFFITQRSYKYFSRPEGNYNLRATLEFLVQVCFCCIHQVPGTVERAQRFHCVSSPAVSHIFTLSHPQELEKTTAPVEVRDSIELIFWIPGTCTLSMGFIRLTLCSTHRQELARSEHTCTL